jgi:hypothetical protein
MTLSAPVRTATIAAGAIAGAFLATGSMAMTLTISENAIASLSNAPMLISLEGAVDEAGRPSLLFELEFPNQCYADIGAGFLLVDGPMDRPNATLIVGQQVPDQGCPDIFQPVRATIRALLPAELAGREVTVVARPAPPELIGTVRLDGGIVAGSGAVREIAAAEEIAPELVSATVQPAETGGYALSGTLRLAPDCGDSDLRVRVFEIPDRDGNPANDAVLVTAPRRCAASGAEDGVEIAVRIETPQPLRGRRVAVLNAFPAEVLTILP